jgi:hypothetical protein
MKPTHCLILVCLAAASGGCAQFDLMEKVQNLRAHDSGEFRRPLKLVAFWTDTTRTEVGKVPERGFGARLMFYDERQTKPVKVKGTLSIYAFDESHRDPRNPRPDRKYVFPAEDLDKHYSKSDLGHSYSFYIAWDDAGGDTKEISLICRFTTVDGAVVLSDQTRQLLPGNTPLNTSDVNGEPNIAAEQAASPVRQVEYQEPAAEFSERRMTTTTIDLPSRSAGDLPTAMARPRSAWPGGPGSIGPLTAGIAAAPAPQNSPGHSLPYPGSSATPLTPAETHGPQVIGVNQPSHPEGSRTWLARFARNRSQAPAGQAAQPSRAPGPSQPIREVRPSVPQSIPPPNPAPESFPSAAAAPQ